MRPVSLAECVDVCTWVRESKCVMGKFSPPFAACGEGWCQDTDTGPAPFQTGSANQEPGAKKNGVLWICRRQRLLVRSWTAVKMNLDLIYLQIIKKKNERFWLKWQQWISNATKSKWKKTWNQNGIAYKLSPTSLLCNKLKMILKSIWMHQWLKSLHTNHVWATFYTEIKRELGSPGQTSP